MKLLRIGVILGLIVSLLLFSAPTFAADQGNGQNAGYERILVKFKAGTDEATRQEIYRRHGDSVLGDISRIGVRVLKIPAGRLSERLSAYRSEKAVQFAEPDFIATAIGDPDPYFSNQWGMTKIQAPDAWDITIGKSDVKIAILDTGVDQDHPDLAAKIVDPNNDNKNFTTSGTVDDLYGHGTHVAGIAAAVTSNGIGVAGVGYDCTIMNGKVLDDTGSGYYSWVASGIIWAADSGAKVISMSLGGSSSSSTLQSAVDYAWSKGVVIVAAAGNNGTSTKVYPAYYTNVIAVAATDQNDAKASWSSYGSWVDVAAPGVNIYSTLPNHSNQIGSQNYGYLSGTSMATPFVAGLAGLVWASSYGTSNASVRNRIESTADPVTGTGTYWQYGRINAYKAVAPAAPQPPSLSVSVSAPSLTNQSSFTVQATVTNSGDVTATGVTVSINLPSGLSTGESLTKTPGDIAGKASATVSWLVTATADGKYTITVDAVATNASTASGTTTVTVDTTPPARVTGLTVTTVSSSQLNLSWKANTDSDLKNYNVYRSTTSGGP
jgi:thermitase